MADSSKGQWKGRSLEEIRQILKKSMPELEDRYKIKSLGIFGSYTRGEAEKSSDLDILVDFNRVPSLLQFIRVEDDLSDRLGIKVDLVMKKALKPYIGRRIMEEVVPV